MKKIITNEQIDNALLECSELISKTLRESQESQKPHIVSLYRGSLPLGVKLSHHLNAPLSIIDYQSYDGDSKKPILMKNAGIDSSELLVIIDDICDRSHTLKLTEEYVRAWFPKNDILIYTIVGSKKHPVHYNYSIEHNGSWVLFPWEQITDTRCKFCNFSEPCRNDTENMSHCNLADKSFSNSHTCELFIEKFEV